MKDTDSLPCLSQLNSSSSHVSLLTFAILALISSSIHLFPHYLAGRAGPGPGPGPPHPPAHHASTLRPSSIMSSASSSIYKSESSTSNPDQPSSSSSGAPPAACAACKFQRRKCKFDCTLAPFFPADNQQRFLNAHRLFGVSNILKIIRDLNLVQRAQAMDTIIYQSDARANDPVGGCHRIITNLEREIERESAELLLMLHQLAICRAQAATADVLSANGDQSNADMNLNVNNDMKDKNTIHVQLELQQLQQQQYFDYLDERNNSNSFSSSTKSIDLNYIKDAKESEMSQRYEVQQHQQYEIEGAYDNVKHLMGNFDTRYAFTKHMDQINNEVNSYKKVGITISDSLHTSKNFEPKEDDRKIDCVHEHDLKQVASLIPVTNYNTSTMEADMFNLVYQVFRILHVIELEKIQLNSMSVQKSNVLLARYRVNL